jgi:Peptidase M15
MFCALGLSACQPNGSSADMEEFRQWSRNVDNQADIKTFDGFLKTEGVSDVIPLSQLLRSDTKWRKCGAEPFSVPPEAQWPHIVPTLKLIRQEVQPTLGPIEALSVYRSPDINTCIKGASRSFHLRFYAIDMRPAKRVARAELIEKLCALHAQKGKALNIGLGIYGGTRFHIDTAGYRRWGRDHTASSSPCASFVAPQRKNR